MTTKRHGRRSGARTLCPICGRRLRGKKGLKMHMEAEHPSDFVGGAVSASSVGVSEQGPEFVIPQSRGRDS
ncbi:hypothetical protein C7435_0033 [Maricaulis maris]|uniref:C2H2-type domain-containing protein n=1 Tax=Maricaulis maris TaxID=74318 RepID=A0A495DKY5_9PROT|nr:hypothetical protein C7435_0033 [Maricaulis maris]